MVPAPEFLVNKGSLALSKTKLWDYDKSTRTGNLPESVVSKILVPVSAGGNLLSSKYSPRNVSPKATWDHNWGYNADPTMIHFFRWQALHTLNGSLYPTLKWSLMVPVTAKVNLVHFCTILEFFHLGSSEKAFSLPSVVPPLTWPIRNFFEKSACLNPS